MKGNPDDVTDRVIVVGIGMIVLGCFVAYVIIKNPWLLLK